MMDNREERGFLNAVWDATNRTIRESEVYLPGDVYRAITRTSVLDQGDVQRLSLPTFPSAKNILKDPGMREAIRRFLLEELPLVVGMDLHERDLFEEASRKAKMLSNDMFKERREIPHEIGN